MWIWEPTFIWNVVTNNNMGDRQIHKFHFQETSEANKCKNSKILDSLELYIGSICIQYSLTLLKNVYVYESYNIYLYINIYIFNIIFFSFSMEWFYLINKYFSLLIKWKWMTSLSNYKLLFHTQKISQHYIEYNTQNLL